MGCKDELEVSRRVEDLAVDTMAAAFCCGPGPILWQRIRRWTRSDAYLVVEALACVQDSRYWRTSW